MLLCSDERGRCQRRPRAPTQRGGLACTSVRVLIRIWDAAVQRGACCEYASSGKRGAFAVYSRTHWASSQVPFLVVELQMRAAPCFCERRAAACAGSANQHGAQYSTKSREVL